MELVHANMMLYHKAGRFVIKAERFVCFTCKATYTFMACFSGAYVWNNVTIKNGCKITNALICDDVVVHEKVTFEKGAILCDKVSVISLTV